MDDKITALLHSQLQDLAKQFAGQYEVGIAIEIQVSLAEEEEIQKFHGTWSPEGYFTVSIFLKHFDYRIASSIFNRLAQFIAYNDATLYTREVEENAVHYIFASLTKSGLRFLCMVDFSQYIE